MPPFLRSFFKSEYIYITKISEKRRLKIPMTLTILFLAVALSMDAFAVSLSNGITLREKALKPAIIIGLFFGVAQGVMPILGYAAGSNFAFFINKYAGVVSLLLLGFIGFNMVRSGIGEMKNPEPTPTPREIKYSSLFMQAIATSIDAMAVGVGFVAMDVNVYSSSLLIGVTTFILCFIGVHIGKKFGAILGSKAEVLGGAVLILIGLKLFFER